MTIKILHVAKLSNNPFSGVCVVVPEHIRRQSEFADVALLNINECSVNGFDEQFVYHGANWKDDVSSKYRKPDIVVFHEVYHIEYTKIARSLSRDGIPYIIIPHGCLVGAAQRKKPLKKLLANTFIFHGFIYHAAALQCLSHNELINTSFTIPKFIGTNGVSLPSVKKISFNKEVIKFIYIGRLEILPKGLDLLLQAVRRVDEIVLYKDLFTINIFGPDFKGRYEEVEKLIKQYNIGKIVKLNHELTGINKIKHLLDSDVFLQTSRHEGMPMGILEAMSYGIPCLITKGTSLGDITSKYDAGWVSETTVESIANMIVKAIQERNLLPEKSSNARKLILENFAWSHIVKSTIDSYKKYIDTKRDK